MENVDIKYAVINHNTSGNNTLVSATAGKVIKVLSAFIMSDGDVDVRFESGADGTAKTGQMPCTTNSGIVMPWNPGGWFKTAAGVLLNMELSGAVGVHGCLTYVLNEY